MVRNTYPVSKPSFDRRELALLKEILASGWVTAGPKVAELEQAIAAYLRVRHTIMVANGTAALFLALRVLGIKPGDEVIVPSFTFIATANVVRHVGAVPVFCDIDERTFNIDPEQIATHITSRTRAIIPVHQFGLAADMRKINRIARARGLRVIEDAACALGTEYRRRKIGTGRNLCCFSFHPRKMITMGEGGAITTGNARLAARLRGLRSHGEAVSALRHRHTTSLTFPRYDTCGYNFRLSDIQAAVGLAQLAKLEGFIARRQELASLYTARLRDAGVAVPPLVPAGCRHTFQSYCVRLASRRERDEVVVRLRRKGVMCIPGIQPIHRQKVYASYGTVTLPATERCSDTTLILPLYHQLREKEVLRISDLFIRAVRASGAKK